MHSKSLIALALALIAGWLVAAERKKKLSQPQYPKTHRSEHVDSYHGHKVSDPYRWLEDLNSKETKAWVKEQNKVTAAYLGQIEERDKIRQRLKKLWNYERFGLPRIRNGRYFFSHNDGLQNQSVLFYSEGLKGKPKLLLDPNKLSEKGTVALAGWKVSDDGKYVAYGLGVDGSDWREWKVIEVSSGKTLSDHIEWVKFSSVSWTPDNQGFFYSRYDKPAEGTKFQGTNYYQKLYYHKLGEPQSKDRLVYERKDEKEWGFGGYVTEDGGYLIIHVWRGTERKNQIFYQDLRQEDAKTVELITGFKSEFDFIGNEGKTFWFHTDHNSPRKRVIAINLDQPKESDWQEIIGEEKEVLSGISLVGDQFFASYLKDAHSLVRVVSLDGKDRKEVKFPGLGSVRGFGGRRKQKETFYSFTNYTTPSTIHRFDIEKQTSSVFRKPVVDMDPSRYVTKQVFVPGKDGTKIPLFITHRKDLKLDGNRPTLLYGYGGFNISLTPGFSVTNFVWMEMGGVYVVANLCGGGEYGREWHEAGMKHSKQNVFDDFIASAQWLCKNGYTNSKKLAIKGGSNGGLLVGAVMCQQPKLFAAALPAVGVMDMLRYHKFTIGWAWVPEYGSSDDKSEFETLLKYSPLHNLKKGTAYPATLVTTADHDDRVVPGHSYKFAAALQHAHDGKSPVLIRIQTSAGHGAATPVSMRIDEGADVLSFLAHQLGVSE